MRSFSDAPNEPSSPRGSKPEYARAGKPKPMLDARKVDRLDPLKPDSGFTYCVLDVVPKTKGKDRRDPPRKRTRLRCGKILDQNGKFLIECQVYDRTALGARLRFVRNVSLSQYIQFFDDEQRALLEAQIIWQGKGEIGIQFLRPLSAQAIKSGLRSGYARKYYAVS